MAIIFFFIRAVVKVAYWSEKFHVDQFVENLLGKKLFISLLFLIDPTHKSLPKVIFLSREKEQD